MKTSLEELSIKARRGELSEAERRQFALLLTGSLEAQLAFRAGSEFDAEDSVLPGDEALATRITQRLLDQTAVPRLRLRRVHPWRLAVAAALAVSAAAATPLLVQRLSPQAGNREVVSTAPKSAIKNEHDAHLAAPISLPPASASSRSSDETSGTPPLCASASFRRRPGAARERPGAESPADMFAEANRVRRQGPSSQAIGLYQKLQRQHPASAEARASDLVLGMLYSKHAPSLALLHFRQYLSKGGPLAPEALWGEAEALSALGQTKEASNAWRTLLSRYPQSAYANAARARLESSK